MRRRSSGAAQERPVPDRPNHTEVMPTQHQHRANGNARLIVSDDLIWPIQVMPLGGDGVSELAWNYTHQIDGQLRGAIVRHL